MSGSTVVGTSSRRRRSSSLIYHEPPETIEQFTDQAALPNLNANWVNSKGMVYIRGLLKSRLGVYRENRANISIFRNRCMGDTHRNYLCSQVILRFGARGYSGYELDIDEHIIHGCGFDPLQTPPRLPYGDVLAELFMMRTLLTELI